MNKSVHTSDRRVLIVDDNRAIHQDFRKLLGRTLSSQSASIVKSEAILFGAPSELSGRAARPEIQIDSAFQGEEGVAMVRCAQEENHPYALAFVDMRMPPGSDGVQTAIGIWQQDPDIQLVICTAYSDYSWNEIRSRLSRSNQLFILKKPFEAIEVLQLADALTERWRMAREDKHRLQDLEIRIHERSRDLETIQTINAQLDAANRRLATKFHSVYDTASTHTQRRRALEQELQHALLAGELTLHYQPVVEIESRRVVSLDALVRWQHPREGLIAPDEFIPVAEESGLITPIGEFVLRNACEQLVRWEREAVAVVPVAVNLSAVQLRQPQVWERVRAILCESGLPPHRLALQLTESTLSSAQNCAAPLRGLREHGVRIQITDFGRGYSRLTDLKHLPIDSLKIARSLVSQIDTNPTDEAIVGAIIAMARSLGLRVAAEGVETPAQLRVLGKHGCEVAQGFFFTRPLPPERCRELLLELAECSSFTDSLRVRLACAAYSTPHLAIPGSALK